MRSFFSHFAACLCAVALCLILGAASGPKSKLVLESPNGKNRLSLDATDNFVGLAIVGEGGFKKENIRIYMTKTEGAVVGVAAADGNQILNAGFQAKGKTAGIIGQKGYVVSCGCKGDGVCECGDGCRCND